MDDLLGLIRSAAGRHGLNLVAAIPVSRYDATVEAQSRAGAVAPEARSAVVIANGGGAFWQAFRKHADTHPGWREREHPLDDFTREVVERDLQPQVISRGARCVPVYPFSGAPTLNFMALGKAVALAGPSILGVVVHPVYGPWVAFRAALLIDRELDAPGDAAGFDPCPSCTVKSCIPACPVGAVEFPKGWDIPRCVAHRMSVEQPCAEHCYARVSCVLGPEHRYPDDELAYHQMRALRSIRRYHQAQGKRTD